MEPRKRGHAKARHRGPARPTGPGMRTCLGCGQRVQRAALLRVVAGPDGLDLDLRRLRSGRGANVHPRRACVARALRGGFRRVFRLGGEDLKLGGGAVDERITELLRAGHARGTVRSLSSDVVAQAPRFVFPVGSSEFPPYPEATSYWGFADQLGAIVGERAVRGLRVQEPTMAEAVENMLKLRAELSSIFRQTGLGGHGEHAAFGRSNG